MSKLRDIIRIERQRRDWSGEPLPEAIAWEIIEPVLSPEGSVMGGRRVQLKMQRPDLWTRA
jgi:hypothetical protein